MQNTVIDISWLNGKWESWPEPTPITGVVIKASEGLSIDPYFHLNAAFLKDRTRVSAYHYFRPCRYDYARFMPWEDWIDAQAHVFSMQYKSSGLQETGLPSFLDLEDTDTELNSWGFRVKLTGAQRLERVKRWLEGVEAEIGIIPGIYTGTYYWTDIGGERADWAAKYPLIIAQYPWDKKTDYHWYYQAFLAGTSAPNYPKAPAPWKHCVLWQWTGRGDPADVPGHPAGKKAVDMNVEWDGVLPPPPPANLYYVNVNAQNVRTGPGMNYSIIKTVPRGTEVLVEEVSGDWAKTSIGWMWFEYLKKAE